MIRLYKGVLDNQIVMGDNGSTPLWVAEDGSWGTSPITIFDAHHWTAKDFDLLDNSTDSEKIHTAMRIADKVNKEHSIEEDFFIDLVRKRASELGLRMFILTDDGMDELLPE